MADRDYNVDYTTRDRGAIQAADDLIARLRTLDQLATSVKPKIAGLTGGAASGLNATTKAVEKLDTSLVKVDASATKAAASLQLASTASQGLATSAATTTVKVQGASASVAGFAGQAVALMAARKVFSEIMDASKELEDYWKRLAKEAGVFRDSLRELASVTGHGGPNNNVVADVLDQALAARMGSMKAAQAFKQAYENVGPAVRDKGHYAPTKGTPEALERAALNEAGVTARRLGIDEDAAGEAFGIAGLAHKMTSVEGAMGEYGGALQGLQEGKLKYKPGVRALVKASAKLTATDEAKEEGSTAGNTGSFGETGVYMGYLSYGTGTADQAAQRMVQISRLLNPDASNEMAHDSAKQIGLDKLGTDQEKLARLKDYMKEQKVTDPKDWLARHKMGTVATREATVAAMRDLPVLRKRMEKFRAGRDSGEIGKKFVGDNAAFLATDRSAQASGIDAVTEAIEKTEAIEGPELFEKAKQAAENRLRLKNPEYANSRLRAVTNKFLNMGTYPYKGVSGEAYEQENNLWHGAIPTLAQEGQKVGIDVYGQFPDLTSGDYRTRARAFTKAAEAVRKAGGDPLQANQGVKDARRKVDAIRSAPAAAAPGNPALPGAGAQGEFGSGPGAWLNDPKAVEIQAAQLAELRSLNNKIGRPASGPARVGPLPIDGADAGPRRA